MRQFYDALNHGSKALSTFYIQPSATNPLSADISLNGNIVSSPADFQTLFDMKVDKAHYEVQSYDCHVLNPNYNIGVSDSALGPDAEGRKISLLVIASGYVKYGKQKNAEMRGFTENFVLVPNLEFQNQQEKKWLIQSQNFRILL